MAQIQIVGSRLYLVSSYVYNQNYDNRMQVMEPYLDSFQLIVEYNLALTEFYCQGM